MAVARRQIGDAWTNDATTAPSSPTSTSQAFAATAMTASTTTTTTTKTANASLSATTTPITVGANPDGVAVSGNRAYVVNGADGSVSVLDTTTNKVVATVPVGSWPQFVAVSPDGARAYVTNYYDNTVSVIDTHTNTVTNTVDLPYNNVWYSANNLAVSPNGSAVYVANQLDGTVSVINTKTNTASGPYALAAQPYGIAVSPNGSQLYLADYPSGSIAVVNTATMTPNGPAIVLGVGAEPRDVAVSPDGNRLYSINDVVKNGTVYSTVSVIDTSPTSSTYDKVIQTIAVTGAASAVALSPDGTRVYVSDQVPGTITVINVSTNQVIGTITADTDGGARDGYLAVGPDGRLYYTDSSDNTVYVIRISSGGTTTL
jgi:YVTN family beta-propeller protein